VSLEPSSIVLHRARKKKPEGVTKEEPERGIQEKKVEELAP